MSLEGRKTACLSLQSKWCEQRELFDSWDTWRMVAICFSVSFIFLLVLTKKLAQMSAVLDLWEYKGCEKFVWVAFFMCYSSLTWGVSGWENRSISWMMPLVPSGAQRSTGRAWHLLNGAFFTSEGAIWWLGLSDCWSQLIICFCFHPCCHAGNWALLLSNSVGYCLGRGTCAVMKVLGFNQLSKTDEMREMLCINLAPTPRCKKCMRLNMGFFCGLLLLLSFIMHHGYADTSLKNVTVANWSKLCKHADSRGVYLCKNWFYSPSDVHTLVLP